MVKPNNSFNAESNPIPIVVVTNEIKKDSPNSMSLLDVLSASTVTIKTLRSRRELLTYIQADWLAGNIGAYFGVTNMG